MLSWAIKRISYELKNEFELAVVKECSSQRGFTVHDTCKDLNSCFL